MRKCPGSKIRSKGLGRGLGLGKGRGPQVKHFRRSKFGKLFRAGSAMFYPMIKKRKKVRRFGSGLADMTREDREHLKRRLVETRNEPWEYMQEQERGQKMVNAYFRDMAGKGYVKGDVEAIKDLAKAMGEDYTTLLNKYQSGKTYRSALDPKLIRELTFQATKGEKFKDVKLGSKPHQSRSGSRPSPLRLRGWE